MPYTMEDFKRQVHEEEIENLSPEERERIVESQPPEIRLKGLSLDTRLEGFPAQEILARLSPSEIEERPSNVIAPE